MKGTNHMKTRAKSRTIAKRPANTITGQLGKPTKQPKGVPNYSKKAPAFIPGSGN